MRVADALSSVGTDVCGDAVSPAARPTPQGAAGSGDPGVDSWVTRLPPARPGSGRGPGSTVTLSPRSVPTLRGDSRPGARQSRWLDPQQSATPVPLDAAAWEGGRLRASRAPRGVSPVLAGLCASGASGASGAQVPLCPFLCSSHSHGLCFALLRVARRWRAVPALGREPGLRRRPAEKHRTPLVWEVVAVAGNQRRTMSHLSFPLPR